MMMTMMRAQVDDDCAAISGIDSNSHDIAETCFVNMSGEDSLEACLGIKGQIEPVAVVHSSPLCDQSFEHELDRMVASMDNGTSDHFPLGLLLDDNSSLMENSRHFPLTEKNLPKSKCLLTSFDNVFNRSTPDTFRQSPVLGILASKDENWIHVENDTSVAPVSSVWTNEFALPKKINRHCHKRDRFGTKTSTTKSECLVESDCFDMATNIKGKRKKKDGLKNLTDKVQKKTKKGNSKNVKVLPKKQQKRVLSNPTQLDGFETSGRNGYKSIDEIEIACDMKSRDKVDLHEEDTKSWMNPNDDDVTEIFQSAKCAQSDDVTEAAAQLFPMITESFSPVSSDFFSLNSGELTSTLALDSGTELNNSIIDVGCEDTCAFGNSDRPKESDVSFCKNEEQPLLLPYLASPDSKQAPSAKQRVVLPKPAQAQSTSRMVVFQLQPVQNISIIKVPTNQCGLSSTSQRVSLPSVIKARKELLPKKEPEVPKKPLENAQGLSEIQLRHPTVLQMLSTPYMDRPDKVQPAPSVSTKRMLLKPRKVGTNMINPKKVVLKASAANLQQKLMILRCEPNAHINGAKRKCLPLNKMAKIAVASSHIPTEADNSGTLRSGSDDLSIRTFGHRKTASCGFGKKLSEIVDTLNAKRKYSVLVEKNCVARNTSYQSIEKSKKSTPCDLDVIGNDETLADVYMRNWKPTGQFQCNICNYSSVTVNFLFRHWLVHHNGLMPYRCRYCEFQAGSRYQVTRHQAYSHRDLAKCVVIVRDIFFKVCQEFEQAFGSSIRVENDGEATLDLSPPVVASPLAYQCSLCECVDIRARIVCHYMMHFDLRAFVCAMCEFYGEDAECVRFHCRETHPHEEPKVTLDLSAIGSMEQASGIVMTDPLRELMQAYGLEVDSASVGNGTAGTSRTLRFVDSSLD